MNLLSPLKSFVAFAALASLVACGDDNSPNKVEPSTSGSPPSDSPQGESETLLLEAADYGFSMAIFNGFSDSPQQVEYLAILIKTTLVKDARFDAYHFGPTTAAALQAFLNLEAENVNVYKLSQVAMVYLSPIMFIEDDVPIDLALARVGGEFSHISIAF